MQIGPYTVGNGLILAPMAGVTDRPFRMLCTSLGAGMVVSEMVSANPALRHSRKTRLRLDHDGEVGPIWVQIAGADPVQLAQAARYNVDKGAQIIDINMGCPAKKVCNAMAGSALLGDEPLVGRILDAVVHAVPVPVTLKIRTGLEPSSRNALSIARIAEQSGVQALTIHGRTRSCGFTGQAEYETIRAVAKISTIPVIVNGDIQGPEQAQRVQQYTGVDAIMVGRAAQGRPWIFREIEAFLTTGQRLPEPGLEEIGAILRKHLRNLYDFYGEFMGVQVARKHVAWYVKDRPGSDEVRRRVNQATVAAQQQRVLRDYFERQIGLRELAA